MPAGLRITRALTTIVCGAAFAVAPVLASAPASACPTGHMSDPYTGRCYVNGGIPTVNGIPCIPGQSLGTCLGILQNQPLPGGGPPPGGPWP